MLTVYKVSQHKFSSVTGALESLKIYFGWYTHQPVATDTTFSITGSPYTYSMHEIFPLQPSDHFISKYTFDS